MVRAVVTGLGCATPIGLNVSEFWSNLVAGVSGVKRITLFAPSDQECQLAAEVKGWDPICYMEAKAAKRAARFSQFAVAAARQAVDDSSLAITAGNPGDIAVGMNTGGGGGGGIAAGGGDPLEERAPPGGPVHGPAEAAQQGARPRRRHPGRSR